ncbi:MAG: dihydrofolate synthase/folylpolyglutamate synthase [Acidimicrobiales bacterium]|jgi:dihydrofolate synthase/folylpolyglutamate synthase
MTLERELRWLDAQVSLEAIGLPKAGATEGLGNKPIRGLLQLLGDPHLDAPVIHLTGTNGKGSTAHMISLILREHGLRVGTYGSPHVSVINERIQIDAEPLTDDQFADALEVVRLAAEHGEVDASWFDLVTATAFRAFSDAAVDVMVIEVGMLGRYDSTNVVDGVVAVVTNISKDHTDGAEGWREAIASEKAGIVKPGSTLILGDIDDDLHHYFEAENPGSVLRFGPQIELTANALGVGGRVIDVRTQRDVYDAVMVSLHGRHQGVNATLAIAAAEAFLDGPLERDHLDAAMGQAAMRGRFEILAADPIIVIDGAHNPQGARTAARTFAEAFTPFGQRMLIVGMMDEKDPVEMLQALDATSAEIVICCEPDWPRAMPATKLAEAARSLGIEPEVATSPSDAIELALSFATEGDAIMVAGSLYVAGAIRDRVLAER